MAVIADRLFVFGGSGAAFGLHRKAQAFDPGTMSWTVLPDMPTARYWAAAAEWNNRGFVFGGFDLINNGVNACEAVR